jgi:hypothetical protein
MAASRAADQRRRFLLGRPNFDLKQHFAAKRTKTGRRPGGGKRSVLHRRIDSAAPTRMTQWSGKPRT